MKIILKSHAYLINKCSNTELFQASSVSPPFHFISEWPRLVFHLALLLPSLEYLGLWEWQSRERLFHYFTSRGDTVSMACPALEWPQTPAWRGVLIVKFLFSSVPHYGSGIYDLCSPSRVEALHKLYRTLTCRDLFFVVVN